MDNADIARELADVATLLEISGANPFRVRAYQNAARTVAEHTTPLTRLVEDAADLTEISGIGKDIAANIAELVETGTLVLLAELTAEVPSSLIEITRLPGLGAKKVRRLWLELGVTTIDELDRAAQANEISGLKGFGAKSQEKILSGISAYRERQGRFKLSDADRATAPLLNHMRELDAVESLEVAGSCRRRRETVGNVDLVAVTAEPRATMERFRSYPGVKSVELSGEIGSKITLRSGLPVELRIVPARSYGSALQYFTGSGDHNARLEQHAAAQGIRMSQYGVFEGGRTGDGESTGEPDAGESLAGGEEAGVYQALGLQWIPPELREDRGEIEAAAAGRLPELVTLDDIRGDLQMHSTWSDGKNTIEEMLDGSVARGYEYFAITDHSKALAVTGGMDAAKLRRQWKEIEEIASRRGEIRILRGMEIDILADGTLDLEDEMLERLDLVVVSVHSRFDLPYAVQTQRIVKALEHPTVNVLAHPTARLINRRNPMQFDLDEVFHAAAEHGVLVELNAHPDRLDLKDIHLMRAVELGLDVVISTDAHRVADLDLIRYGVEQARRAWLTKDEIVNTLPLNRLLERIAK